MANSKLEIKIKFKWWFVYLYIPLMNLSFFIVRGIYPEARLNQDRLNLLVKKAVVMRVKPNNAN